MSIGKLLVKVGLPLVVLGACAAYAQHLYQTRPEPERRARPVAALSVEVMEAWPVDYPVQARSRGTVRPRTEGTLIPEVSGRVTEMSPRLRAGQFFEAGDVLLRIDPREFEAATAIARAELTQARSLESEERARSEQAGREWRRLGEAGEPDALVLRKPQLAAANAAVRAARARLTRAELDLERTAVVAPYAGRVLEQNVDVGQYVSTGTVLARIYAVDYVEIRLPLTNRQLEFVTVPESYRGEQSDETSSGPVVVVTARIGRARHRWEGRVVRAEGAVDTASRQLFVIAQVLDPYGKGAAGRPPLKIGQFVEAEIAGQILTRVFALPRGALRAGDAVLVVGESGRLERRDVHVVWKDASNAVVDDGLVPGDRVVTTALGLGMIGTEVRIAPAAPAAPGAPATGAGS